MKQKNIKRDQILTTAFLFFIIFAVTAFIVFGLRWFNLVEFPAFIENLLYLGGADNDSKTVDDAYIYKMLPEYTENAAEPDGMKIVTAEITGENLISILSALKIPEVVYAETETTHYTDGASRKTESAIRKSGSKLRLENSEEYFIIDTESGEEYYYNYADRSGISYQSVFSWRSVPDVYLVGDYFNLAVADGVIEELKVERGGDETILSFKFLNEALKQREEYVISLDSGLVKSITSYFGGKKYYEYRAVKILYADNGEDAELLPFVKDSLFNVAG